MEKLALFARLKARPGKEQQLEDFLKSALPLAQQESGTVHWYALQFSASEFGIYDTFNDEAGRQAHIQGEIAKALFAKAAELLSEEPKIHQVTVLAAK